MPPTTDWLMVIDMQRGFADSPSPWAAPDFYTILPRVEQLIAAYKGRVIATRYVAPTPPYGAWQRYFEVWEPMLLPPDDPAWDLKFPVTDGIYVETRDRFSKWDNAISERIGPDATLTLCGVATECCVLATALGAIDAGRYVRLVSDACAGATPLAHEQALSVMGCAAPLLTCVTTQALLSS